MKSGKADEHAIRGKVEPKENNKADVVALSGVLHNIRWECGSLESESLFAFYTRYPLLYPSCPSWAMVRRVILICVTDCSR